MIKSVLPQPLAFEWDEGNKDKNWVKHKITTYEAEEVFQSSPIIYSDLKHSVSEERYYAYGKTKTERFLLVVFTIRNKQVRIISARVQNKKERKFYVETQKNSSV